MGTENLENADTTSAPVKENDPIGVKLLKQAKRASLPKKRVWSMVNEQNRYVAAYLNKLSASGSTVFSVNQSSHIGGTYEILSYIDVEVE